MGQPEWVREKLGMDEVEGVHVDQAPPAEVKFRPEDKTRPSFEDGQFEDRGKGILGVFRNWGKGRQK